MDDGRVVGGELYEIVDDVGEEDEEEEGGADEGGFGGNGVVFGDGDETEDVDFSEDSEEDVGLFFGDEGTVSR